MSAKVFKRRGSPSLKQRSLSMAPSNRVSAPLYELFPHDQGVTTLHSSSSSITVELQRVAKFFQGTCFISEAEFVMNCKAVMNMMHYSHSEKLEPWQQVLVVDVVESAIITFMIRVLPLVFQELVSPTSLLHPISPPMVIALLQVADSHVDAYGDFTLQLRMAVIYQLLRDNGDVALAFAMCQGLPRIIPNSKWQKVITPVKAYPATNIHGSISLPEIHPPVFPASPSASTSSALSSPVPSLSSLLNCTPSSSSSISKHKMQLFDANHTNTITETTSLPSMSVTHKMPSCLAKSSSTPNLHSVHPPKKAIVPPPMGVDHPFDAADASMQDLFSPPRFSPGRDADAYMFASNDDDSPTFMRTSVQVQLLDVENTLANPPGALAYPSIVSVVSEDGLSRLISAPDVSEVPPLPSLFTPNPDDHPPDDGGLVSLCNAQQSPSPSGWISDSPASISVSEILVQFPCVDDAPALAPPDAPAFPSIVSVVSEDDLSRLICASNVDEEASSQSLFTPNPNTHSPRMSGDFTLSISQPDLLDDSALASPGPKEDDSLQLSPLLNQVSSPLSSPPRIIVQEEGDKFLNTYELEVKKRPPSPYNKRLRSASNNPQTTMRRALPAPRTVSATIPRLKKSLDDDLRLAGVTLPPPPKQKTTGIRGDVDTGRGRKSTKRKSRSDSKAIGVGDSPKLRSGRRSSNSKNLADKEN